jgi:uncharacterized membrane protein
VRSELLYDQPGFSMPTETNSPAAPAAGRLHSIDILRGLVMVIMALDHVREYATSVRFDPLDIVQTNVLQFFTRWITHYCAPIFVLLAGTSAYLVSRRMTRAQLSRFLLTRGLWLIALEFSVVTFVWSFNFRYDVGLIMQVIWAIGGSMVVLAALVQLPVRAVAAIGWLIVLGHNLLDGISPQSFGDWAPLWDVLHVQAFLPGMATVYPILPWIGVMAVGYGLGTLFELDPGKRRRSLLVLGTSMIIGFIVLRWLNVYGDLVPRVVGANGMQTVLSFLNVTKYPPSLLYVLMTVGPGLLLLAAFESAHGAAADVLRTYGRVPLFFYVIHIAVAHLVAGLLALATGYGSVVLTNLFLVKPPGWGFGLSGVYVMWAIIVVSLYPACRWFARIKATRRDWWLSYL